MTEWASKIAFLFIPLLIAVVAWRFLRRRHLLPALQVSTVRHIKSIGRGIRSHVASVPMLLKALAILLMIVALARPREPSTQMKRNVEGIDIMVVLDVSDSMLIEDMLPENRLESSKKTIADFVGKRVSDRIGLVVFSGESYTRVPLTLDYPLLLQSVKEIKTSRNIKMGTAIGVALANAVARIKDSTAKSKVIIFLTDGENNSGTIDPETALEIAKGFGIKIYSIGMGVDGQAQLPVFVQDGMGNTIKQYRPMHSTVNEELLGRFAKETGGKFWRATTTKGLEDVFNEIDRLEKTKIDVDKFTRYAELFPGYLKWAFGLYVLAIILGQTVLRRNP